MFKPIIKALDATLGRAFRHFFFILVRPYYSAFYNVSISNKHLLQDLPGGLILASHVSRHDGPMLAALLYSTKRVRPAVLYSEYHNWLQWFPMVMVGAVPMSSPKTWAPERRARQKDVALGILRKVIAKGNLVLLFPSGGVRREAREVIKPRLSGAYDVLKAMPDIPVAIIRIEGMTKFEAPIHDLFWSFLFIHKGRRHVNITIDVVKEGLNTDCSLEEFNQRLEDVMNGGAVESIAAKKG